MSSPTQGVWDCPHGIDGRDECEECFAPATLTKYEVYEASVQVGAVYAENIDAAKMDFWTSFLKDDHRNPYSGGNFILCYTLGGDSRVFIVRAEQ